jgi:hypothetical protein
MTSDELIADAAARSHTPQSWNVTVSESKFYWYDLLIDAPAGPDFRDPLGRYLRRMQFAIEATMEKRLMYALVSRPRLRFDTTRSTSWGFFSLKLSLPVLVGAEGKRQTIAIELKVPEDATLKKPTVQVFERFVTLNWGSLLETYSIHDLLQSFDVKLDYPSKVHYVGQTHDPAGKLLKGRVSGVNRAMDQAGSDVDYFLLIQRLDIRSDCMSDPASELSDLAQDLQLKDQMDLLECALIKYFEDERADIRGPREVQSRQARVANLEQAHRLQRLHVDLGLESVDAFQNLYSDMVAQASRHQFECTFRQGEIVFNELVKV